MKQILVVNTGSTSTKIALFHDDREVDRVEIPVPEDLVKNSLTAVEQLDYRVRVAKEALDQKGIDLSKIDMVAARGGMLPAIQGGAYAINDYMIDVVTYAPATQHESSLACMVARRLADPFGLPAIIYDGVTLDEMDEIAKMTGVPSIRNPSSGHPLNARKVAREAAKKLGIRYEDGNFIVVHFGGSISCCAHKHGRIVDSMNPYTGAMSPQRAGRLPTDQLVKLCFSGKYTQKELMKLLNGKSGFMAYCGTQNGKEVFAMAERGDENARKAIAAIELQVSKCIADMFVSINEPVNAICFSGGMARNEDFLRRIYGRVSFIAPMLAFPGEFEMAALAEGALRVLNGEIPAKEFDVPPAGYASKEEFYQKINKPAKETN